MRIAIIGYGFVGKALESAIKKDVDIFKVDPLLNTKISDLEKFNPEIAFVCVPTPMNDDGSQDISAVKNVLHEISNLNMPMLVVLKSTILPNLVIEIEKVLPNIVLNPEFLREKHASEDFINGELILFGGNKSSTSILANFYKSHTLCKCNNYQFTDLISASLIKYSINTFLSTKVIFFNQLFNIFNNSKTNDSWENFIEIISVDERIGDSHMQVPGHDKRLGFGGSCFPKDCNAFYDYSNNINTPFELLKNVISINNNIRNKYKDKSTRENDQNINFNINLEKN